MGIQGMYKSYSSANGCLTSSGLLPLLKSIHKVVSLRKFEGKTLAVDAYGWLHRGTVACAMELAMGKPTKKYLILARLLPLPLLTYIDLSSLPCTVYECCNTMELPHI